MRQKKGDAWIALALSLFGAVFWLGSLVWTSIIAAGFVIPFILCLIAISPYIIQNLNYAFGQIQGVSFNTPFWGLLDLFLGIIPLLFVFYQKKERRWQVWCLVALVCTILSARFDILLIPFIGLGAGVMINWAKEKSFLVV